jgi:hypothetical protein
LICIVQFLSLTTLPNWLYIMPPVINCASYTFIKAQFVTVKGIISLGFFRNYVDF